MKEVYSFDDVLLVPQQSPVLSRNDINLRTWLGEKQFSLPIIGAPMDSLDTRKMHDGLARYGTLGILTRCGGKRYAGNLSDLAEGLEAGAAVGLDESLDDIYQLISYGVRFICVDVANGHLESVQRYVEKMRQEFPRLHIMAGNVSTYDGFRRLNDAGASSIRVGIGGGSACTTRVVTGHGIPTLQSVMDIYDKLLATLPEDAPHATLIADGGIRNSGDAVKALAAGADFVMLGKVLAHAEEARQGAYRGMASAEAQQDWRGKVTYVEGVTVGDLPRRPLEHILKEFEQGIRSGLSYSGVLSLEELRHNAEFVRVTQAGIQESRPHGML